MFNLESKMRSKLKSLLVACGIISAALPKSMGGEAREQAYVTLVDKITKHAEKSLGPLTSSVSFKMLESGDPLTILIFGPTKERNFYTLVTAGMSQNFTSKDKKESPCEHELVLCLPVTWNPPKNVDDVSTLSDHDKLPISVLLFYSEVPRKHQLKLGYGHTMKLVDSFPNFTHLHFNFTLFQPEFEIMLLKKSDKNMPETIMFLGVFPITQEEYELMKAHDSDYLMDHLLSHNVSLVFNASRKSTV